MPTIGVSSAKAVARMRMPQSDASTAVTALIENASAAGIDTGTENGTESIAESAKETRSETERDGNAIGNETGNETATATVSAVIDTDETKRIVIGRAGKTARSAVERCSPRKTVVSLFVRDIALPPLPMRHLGSEEGPVTMTYVSTRQ